MDYSKYNKEELTRDYTEYNLSIDDMMNKYGVNSRTSMKRILSFYNIKKPPKTLDYNLIYNDYIKNNMPIAELAKKYNCSTSHITAFLLKNSITKNQEAITVNRLKTFERIYGKGVKAPLQSKEVYNKMVNTNLEKYGVTNVFANKTVKSKIKKTLQDKYGVTNPMYKQEFCEKQTLSMSETNMEKYGIEWACLLDNCMNSSNGAKHSSINDKFAELLEQNNIQFEREYIIKDRSFDFKIDNILIELDPWITHNSSFGYKSREPMDVNYHKNKSQLANTAGFRCIHIFDWDDQNKIINMLKTKESIYARKCEIKEIDDIDTILNENHLQGSCQNQKIKLGLYYNNELVEVMSFGKPRYNKNYQYELLRLCTDSKYRVIGGAEKLFKYFVNNYNPESILSYCDMSKFSGDVYTRLGFKLKRVNQPSCHWYKKKSKSHILDSLLRKHGYDQLFNTNYGKGKSNEDLMLENGFVKVYDCGQALFIWKNNKVDA